MPTVKNINDIKYFLQRFPTIDSGFDYYVPYHPKAKSQFKSLPTFMAEFFDCKVHSCPLLVTNENHLITNHVWNLTHKRKHKKTTNLETKKFYDQFRDKRNFKFEALPNMARTYGNVAGRSQQHAPPKGWDANSK